VYQQNIFLMDKNKKEKKEALYKFIKPFKTDKKTFKVGEDCFFEDVNVINYLLTNKIIK